MVAEWQLARSRLRGPALAVIIFALLLALYYTGPREPWHWLVLAALLALFVYDTARHWCSPVSEFSVQHGQWWLLIDGERVAVQLQDSHFSGHRLGVIRFRTAAGVPYAVTILPDSMGAEACRKLALALA